jgi:hypothetical protein
VDVVVADLADGVGRDDQLEPILWISFGQNLHKINIKTIELRTKLKPKKLKLKLRP